MGNMSSKNTIINTTGGAAHVRPIPGTGQASKNRLMNPDATPAEATNRATWVAGEDMRRFRIWAYPDAQLVSTTNVDTQSDVEDKASYNFVIDAIDYAAGNLLLAETGGAAADVQIFKGKYNEPTEWFEGISYFSSVQFDVPVDSKIYIEAQ